jgi:2,4-dienoyl-CoA reductase (NADPH2)
VAHLFDPFDLRGLRFRNRIGVSPMCQYSALDGRAQDWHLVHLGALAAGGAGLVVVEATAVLPEGRISPWDLGLWDDSQADPLVRIAAFIRSQGAVPGIQLAHAGRKAGCARPWEGGRQLPPEAGGWSCVAPSPLPFHPGEAPPVALDESGLERIAQAFAAAARRAVVAGFQVVELHAAHGYLLHQFCSPLSNRRSDAFGGSLENRLRFPLRVAAVVRNALPEAMPLFVRASATDWVLGGWDLEQTVEFARCLHNQGADLIDVSSGGLIPDAVVPVAPGYQVPFAADLRARTGLPTAAVGLITEPNQAEAIVAAGQADLVLLGRQLLREPQWPLRAARELGAEADWPLQYQRAR